MKGTPSEWFGAVIAGGRSVRMGSDKADLVIEGKPLWMRQLGVLRDAGIAEPVLVRSADQPAPKGVKCLRDSFPGIGPMGGLHAALAAAGNARLALLAVDMPGIGPDWFAWLSSICPEGQGAMARHSQGCEPLAAVYPPSALAVVEESIARRDYSLQTIALRLAELGTIRLVEIRSCDVGRTQSVNTVEHLRPWAGGQGS